MTLRKKSGRDELYFKKSLSLAARALEANRIKEAS